MSGKLHSISIRAITLAALICALAMACAAQTQNSVTASVQPAQVSVGESLNYQVSIAVNGTAQPTLTLPSIDPDTGFSSPSPAGQQSSVERYITNGSFHSVRKIIYLYSIKTSKVGSFTIPPASVEINGTTYKSNPVTVEVRSVPKATNVPDELEGLVAAPSVPGKPELQRKLNGVVFILPVLSNTEPYNGEQVNVSYHLVIEPEALRDADLLPRTNLDGVNVPPMNEFITEELYPFPQDLKFQERKIGGKLYLVAPVYEAVITSTKTGKLQIEPFQISMIFSMRSQGRRAQSPFSNDPFFSTLGGPLAMMGGNSVQVIAQSPQLALDVKPVPQADRPADFAGAVGSFKMSAKVDKTQAKAYDETLNLDVTIQGEGNTESLSPPQLPSLPGFTVLGDPEMTTAGHKDEDKYLSIKKFVYTLRPTTPGQQTIPPIKLSYFEPKKETFVEMETDPISLEITPGSNPVSAPLSVASTGDEADEDPTPVEPDLRYISTETLSKPNSGLRRFRGAAGIALFLLPPSLLLAAGLVSWARNRSQHKQTDPRKLAKMASTQHLRNAHHALDAKDTKTMAAELAEGIRLFFASQFGMTTAEVTIPVIEETLARKGAPESLISDISRVLETCDSTQYAPLSGSTADARQIYKEAVSLLKKAEAFS